MLEIELKAHVENCAETEKRLASFATFLAHVRRDDVYFKGHNSKIKIRVRTETDLSSEKNGEKKYLLTYKQKELRKNADGKAFEVNSEKECELSNPDAIEAFLADSGFSVDLKKTKEVFDWKADFSSDGRDDFVLCELCEVPPLGWFLELEILVDEEEAAKNPKIVEEAREKLEETLKKAGISKEKIENRYYSEMLREANHG